MPNSHAVPVLLDNEVSALKCRLAEATIALDRIEAAVVAIDKDAPPRFTPWPPPSWRRS